MRQTVTLYRPANPLQLAAIANRCHYGFGEESVVDGFFYPMLHRDFARSVARSWHRHHYGHGYVLAVTVDAQWLAQFRPQTVATARQLEYRIPQHQLDAFNSHLRGPVRVIERHGKAHPRPAAQPCWQPALATGLTVTSPY